jgi:hypothetical protein
MFGPRFEGRNEIPSRDVNTAFYASSISSGCCWFIGKLFIKKSSIHWNINPCNQMKFYGCFGRTYRIDLQSRWVNQVRNA